MQKVFPYVLSWDEVMAKDGPLVLELVSSGDDGLKSTIDWALHKPCFRIVEHVFIVDCSGKHKLRLSNENRWVDGGWRCWNVMPSIYHIKRWPWVKETKERQE